MIHSALTHSMSVADLAPKAATNQSETKPGDGAFEEALAGAHTVHDQRETHASERGLERGRAIGASDRSRAGGAERGAEETRGSGRARHDEQGEDAATATDDAKASKESSEHSNRLDTETNRSERTNTRADHTEDAGAAASLQVSTEAQAQAESADAAQADVSANAAAAATIAVAAAPVQDLDAIIVPTVTLAATPVATTDAIDAAMRLAIDAGAAATKVDAGAAATKVDADATATTAAATTTEATAQVATTSDDASATVNAATLRGAEDIEGGDATAGQKSPIASTPATTSGPSPMQLTSVETSTDAAATIDASAKAASTTQLDQVAQVATGDTSDAGAAALVQSAVVEAGTDAPAATDDDAVILRAQALDGASATTASTTTAAAGDITAAADVEVVDADAPQVAQVARNAQGQSSTVAANVQFQAQVQAKVAEQQGEKGSTDAGPTKVDTSMSTQAQMLQTTRTEAVPAGVRVREGLLAAGQQARIDHIAEQLATRLKLSQASGGTQVQLNLKPRELGEVSVQMNIRDGVVAATVLVERADTLDTLQTNLDDLKRSLEEQGLSIQEFSVDVRGDAGAGGANARAAADLRNAATRTSSGSAASLAGAEAVIPGLSGDREVDPDAIHDGDVSVLA